MLTIQQPSFTGLGEQFCRAAQQNGYKQTDLNTKFSEGSSIIIFYKHDCDKSSAQSAFRMQFFILGCDVCTYTTKKGYRNSAYNAFLKKIKDRWNLVVKKYAHVNKVFINYFKKNLMLLFGWERALFVTICESFANYDLNTRFWFEEVTTLLTASNMTDMESLILPTQKKK